MTGLRFDRRSLLKLAGTGLASGVVAAGTTHADGGTLQDQLDDAASATERYSDPRAALDDGFVVLGPYVPGMGWHLFDPDRLGSLDVAEPQMLTYDDTGETRTLASVEYAIPVGEGGTDAETPPDLFDDDEADAEEHWHVHPHAEHVFAVPPAADGEVPSLESVPVADRLHTDRWVEFVPGGDPGNPMFEPGMAIVTDFASGAELDTRVVVTSRVHPDLWTLHAWVHERNPDGVFAETNRTLANNPRP